MALVYNLNFKAFWKTGFMNCVERLILPVKTIHKIPILKGKLKVKAMERLYSCICRGWMTQIGCLWKLMRKLPVKQAVQEQCQLVKWAAAFREMIYSVWNKGNHPGIGAGFLVAHLSSAIWFFLFIFSIKSVFAYEEHCPNSASSLVCTW